MIRRLLEAHFFQNSTKPDPAQVRFWLRELRTPQLLVQVAQRHALDCQRVISTRPLLGHAALGKIDELERALIAEESAERERDRRYWSPLRAELEKLRHAR
jgi:hypothetical protein